MSGVTAFCHLGKEAGKTFLVHFIFLQIPARLLLSIAWSHVLLLTASFWKQLQKTRIATSYRPHVYLRLWLAELANLHTQLNRVSLPESSECLS